MRQAEMRDERRRYWAARYKAFKDISGRLNVVHMLTAADMAYKRRAFDALDNMERKEPTCTSVVKLNVTKKPSSTNCD